MQQDAHPPGSEDVAAVQRLKMSIPLKPQDRPANFPPNFTHAVREEYAMKYLARIGANATPANIALVLEHLPLEDCHLTTAWRSRGSITDQITIDMFPRPPKPEIRSSGTDSTGTTHGDSHNQTLANRDTVGLATTKAYQFGSLCMSFDDMKRQYLLPFKHAAKEKVDVLTTYGMKNQDGSQSSSNQIHHQQLQQNLEASVRVAGRKASMRRVESWHEREEESDVKPEAVLQMLKSFYGALPLATLGLRSMKDRESLYEALLDSTVVQLILATAKYLNLHIFASTLEVNDTTGRTIKEAQPGQPTDKELAYVASIRLFTRLKQKWEKEDKGLTLFLPLGLLALRVAVETIFKTHYAANIRITTSATKTTLQKADAAITNLLDPDEYLSRIGILEATCESTKIQASHAFQLKKRPMRLRDQFFKTSDALRSVFPHPVSGKCRRIISLRGGSSISNYPLHLDAVIPEQQKPQRQPEIAYPAIHVPMTKSITSQNQVEAQAAPFASDTRLHLLRIMEKKTS